MSARPTYTKAVEPFENEIREIRRNAFEATRGIVNRATSTLSDADCSHLYGFVCGIGLPESLAGQEDRLLEAASFPSLSADAWTSTTDLKTQLWADCADEDERHTSVKEDLVACEAISEALRKCIGAAEFDALTEAEQRDLVEGTRICAMTANSWI